jgi:hypothetical protein
MSERRASVFVCDELFFTLVGKVTISGMYTTNDIAIPGDELRAAQMVFVFLIETPVEDPLMSITLKVTFPGSDPVIVPPQNMGFFTDPRRKVMVSKQPFLIQQPLLRPGRIETAVIHDKGEINAGDIWITSLAAVSATGSNLN